MPPTATEITARLNTVLRRHLRFVDELEAIPPDSELIDLGLDSLSAINLLLELEEEFGVAFPDELLSPETFRTAANLNATLQQLLQP